MMLALLLAVAPGCQEPTAQRAADSSLRSLPDLPGFSAGALQSTPQYVRRVYTRSREKIAVTLARLPMSAEQYRNWVEMSVASFPQVQLDVADGDGNAFHECSREKPERCDLLVQLRCGAHLEIRGEGAVALQRGADAIGALLPMRARSELCEPAAEDPRL